MLPRTAVRGWVMPLMPRMNSIDATRYPRFTIECSRRRVGELRRDCAGTVGRDEHRPLGEHQDVGKRWHSVSCYFFLWNMPSMRCVTRNPPTTLIMANTTARKPSSPPNQRARRHGQDRADHA